MSPEYLTYRQFNDMALAKAMAQQLTDSGIPNQVHDATKAFDPSFANNTVFNNIYLKIQPADFTRADAVLQASFTDELADISSDYYLYQFTNQELHDVVAKSDEWGPFNHQLALHLLQQRGNPVPEEEQKLLQFRRINELAEPESIKEVWLVLGYAAALLGELLHTWGGFAGIIAGWALVASKKTLPDGLRVPVYNAATRRHGKAMIIIAAIVTALVVGLRVWWLSRLMRW